MMKKIYASPRFPFLLIALAGIALGFASMSLSALLKIPACPLCIIQRLLNLLLGGLGIIGLLIACRPWLSRLWAFLCAVVCSAGIVTAAYQTWLQRYAPDVSCSAEEAWWEKLANWFGHQWPGLFKVSGACSDASFKIFGFSLAEWSLLGFVVLLVIALYALVRKYSARAGLCLFSSSK